MKGDPGEELRGAFEEWLEGWSADVLPRKRKDDGPYLSHHTELAWLAFKAGRLSNPWQPLPDTGERHPLTSTKKLEPTITELQGFAGDEEC